MPRKIPSEIIRKLYTKNVDSAFLALCTFQSGDETLRIVNNPENITYNDDEYTATSFTIVLPDDQTDTVSESTLVIADVNNTFLDIVRNYNEVFCTIEIVAVKTVGNITIGGVPTQYQHNKTMTVYETKVGPYDMKLSNAQGGVATTSFTIASDDIADYQFPKVKFNTSNFSGLY